VQAFQIDLSEATQPPESYGTIGDLFCRDIKSELRPIVGDVTCPVDGRVRDFGVIGADGILTQVKGKSYRLADLLRSEEEAKRFIGGSMWNFYLSPRDAHHIFSPVDGEIVKTVHIPGKLWPVNEWALGNIEALFAVNERIVTYIRHTDELWAVVMIGATNVGHIKLQYMDLETNKAPWKKFPVQRIDHNPGFAVQRGKKIGTFMMGSSVVLLSSRMVEFNQKICPNQVVKFGQALTAPTTI